MESHLNKAAHHQSSQALQMRKGIMNYQVIKKTYSHNTQRPYINFIVILCFVHNLRRHPIWSPYLNY